MPYGVNDLLKMSREELDALFAQSPAGPIPNGDAKGTAILDPGSSNATQFPLLASSGNSGASRVDRRGSGGGRRMRLPVAS